MSAPASRAGRLTAAGIALDGVPEGAEGSGLDRLELPRDLYRLSADLEHLRPLVGELTNVSASVWSSDGRWLALALKPEDGVEGLYLVEVTSGNLILVRAGRYGAPAWLPGDKSLAVPVGIDANFDEHEGDVGLQVVTLPDDERFATAG